MVDATPAHDAAFVLKSPMRGASVVLFALMAVGALLLLVLRDSGWVDSAWMGCATVVFSFLAWRSSRAAVRCDATGVASTDINIALFRPRRITWAQLERFEQRDWRGIGARLTTGRWVPLLYYATLGDLSQEKATELLEQQRALHQTNPQRPTG